jgi:hypothetical protein
MFPSTSATPDLGGPQRQSETVSIILIRVNRETHPEHVCDAAPVAVRCGTGRRDGVMTEPLFIGVEVHYLDEGVARAAAVVSEMAGQFRIPDALKLADRLARGLELPAQPPSASERQLIRRAGR